MPGGISGNFCDIIYLIGGYTNQPPIRVISENFLNLRNVDYISENLFTGVTQT
jgi:hypothetical protein